MHVLPISDNSYNLYMVIIIGGDAVGYEQILVTDELSRSVQQAVGVSDEQREESPCRIS